MNQKKAVSERALGSVPVVMFFLNVNGEHLVPDSATKVPDNQTAGKSHTGKPGIMLCQGKSVDLEGALKEIELRGYLPKKFTSIHRFQGIMHRMVLVCVHKDAPDNGEAASFTAEQREDFLKLLQGYNWDTTVYRNFSETGGNFILMAGNPDRREEKEILRVNDANEFEMVDAEKVKTDQSRTRGREALSQISA